MGIYFDVLSSVWASVIVHRRLPCCATLSRQSNGVVAVQNIKLVEKVDQLAKAKGVESGQLALAWVHSQVLHIYL